MASSVVIKVKYGDTLRRFNASVNGEQHFDLSMESLRLKICSLFNLPSNANFILTYRDEDDDLVTLADDEDLHDVVRQGLNPVRITVDLKSDVTVPTPRGSGGAASVASSTPVDSTPIRQEQNFIPNIPEVLNSVPEPLRGTVSKISTELASKAALTSPILSELLDGLSKMGQSYLKASQSDIGTTNIGAHAQGSAGSKQDALSAKVDGFNDEGVKHNDIQKSGSAHQSPSSTQATREAEPKRPSPSNSSSYKGKNSNSGICSHKLSIGKCKKKNKELIDNFAKKSGVNDDCIWDLNGTLKNPASSKKETSEPNFSNFQFGGSYIGSNFNSYPPVPFPHVPQIHPVPYPHVPQISPVPPMFNKADGLGPTFHRGVRCDGCGIFPITGPRFKSKVKHDYDLCSICFAQIGNNVDYTRIDYPLLGSHCRRTRSTKGCNDQVLRTVAVAPEEFPLLMENLKRNQARPRLDSRFVKDINVMDGTMMAPLTPFTKIWRMRNNGTLAWQHGLKLLWIGGDRFSASDSVEIELPVNGLDNGNEVDIAVDFVAPELPGRYVSYWRMAEPSGHKFGHRVWVSIQVDASVDLTDQSSSKLDLNLHPEPTGAVSSQVVDNSEPVQNAAAGDLGFPSTVEQIEDLNFPINDDLIVASDVLCPTHAATSSSTSSPIRADKHATPESSMFSNDDLTAGGNYEQPSAPPANLYPIIDSLDVTSASCSTAENAKDKLEQDQEKTKVEETLLKELESMGFKEIDLNKSVLRVNNYDLEQSVDDLCGVSEWDPILEELQEMGFKDKETNKKLLTKNNGSITRVVMDLIAGETPPNQN